MDCNSPCGASIAEDENSEAKCNSSSSSVDKVSDRMSGMLKGDENRRRIEDYEDDDEEEEEEEEDLSDEALLAQMGYGQSEPKRDKLKEPQKQYNDDEEDEEEEDLSEESILAQMGYLKKEPPKHEPITTPTAALNLVSAFKGSREKKGKPTQECRVSWAPDVYDPPPTSDDHYAASKVERHKNEQKVKGAAGKKRQKSGGKGLGATEVGVKGSKGGGIKGNVGGGVGKGAGKEKAPGKDKVPGKEKDKKQFDKKQVKKHGGSASKYSKYDEL